MAKMGRPTDNPKTERIEIRITKEDKEKIDFCAGFYGGQKTAAILAGVDLLENELKRKKATE